MTLHFIEPQLLLIKVSHCGNRDFLTFFCSCDLDLDLMTFIYELNPYSLERYRMCKYKLFCVKAFESYRLKDKQTDTREDRNYYSRVVKNLRPPKIC